MVELVPEGRLWTPRFVVLCMASLSYFMALGSTWPVVPAFVENDLGGGGVAVGLSMGAFGFSAALLRPLIGPLGDRRGRRLLLAIGSVAVCASLLLLILDGADEATGDIALRRCLDQ